MNLVMSSVIQAVCVLHLCSPAPHDVQQTATLTVGVSVTSDRSSAPPLMMLRAKSEAQAIWRAYGVAYHDSEGLMRSSFGAVDLTGFDRRRVRLSARSVSRLRARMAMLFEPAAADRCM